MKRIFLALAIVLLMLSSCAPAKKTLADEILGTWVNKDGFSIQFQSGGNGFIPGVAGSIPDSNFAYTVTDDSHIKIDLGGQIESIEIVIAGDQLTWRDSLGDVGYTRVK
jgi:hypothetical protein